MPRLEGEKPKYGTYVLGALLLLGVAAGLYALLSGSRNETANTATTPDSAMTGGAMAGPTPPDGGTNADNTSANGTGGDGNAMSGNDAGGNMTDGNSTSGGAMNSNSASGDAMNSNSAGGAMDGNTANSATNSASGNSASGNATSGNSASSGAGATGSGGAMAPSGGAMAPAGGTGTKSSSAAGNEAMRSRSKTITNNKTGTSVTYRKDIKQDGSTTHSKTTSNSATR